MTNSPYFPALTGIRAVAAYAVCFHHFNCFMYSIHVLNNRFIDELYIGVTLFFVLSGFLITLRYYDKAKLTKNWFLPYLQNRFARIFPMYFLLTTATFLVLFYQQPNWLPLQEWFWRYITNITFIRGFIAEWAFTGVSQGWSLTVEECFYFSAPFIFIFSKRFSAFWLLIPLLGVAFLFNDFKFALYTTFFGRGMEFLVGMQLALWVRKAEKGELKPKIFFKFPIFTVFSIFYILICLDFLVSFRIGEKNFGVQTVEGLLLNNFVLPWGIAALFWGLIYEKTWLRWLLGTPVFQLLGKASFVFYLIHFGIIRDYLNEEFFNNVYYNCFYLFIALNILSILLYWLIEQPIYRKLKAK